MKFEDIRPESIILELRYPQGYLYWDNCGKIFKDITDKWREAGTESVSLQDATIKYPEKNLSVKFSPSHISVALLSSSDTKSLGEFADSVVNTICSYLDVDVFSRVGNRFQYIKKLDADDDFSQIFSKSGLMNIPEAVTAHITGKATKQEIKFTLEREDSFGYNFCFAQFGRSVNIELPKSLTLDASKFISKGIMFDIDMFTLKPVERSTLSCSELLRKNVKDYEFLVRKFI
jgi:hypothetical protein